MVVKEEINNTYGPHGGLKFTTEPDFITLDKATQTSYEEEADDLTQGKRANSFQAHTFVPSKERYYILQTKTKVVRENASPITPESESGDILLNEKQIKKDADKNLEQHQNISLQPDEKAFNEIAGKADTTATVTGQILLAVASLRDTDKTNIQAATAMLNSILKKERNKLSGKVPEIIDIIYFHLRAIQEPSAREAAIGAVCLLAEKHTEETISSLLRLSLLCDRHISKIWEALGQAKQPVRLQVLAKLLEALKKKPCLKSEHPGSNTNLKDNSSLLPLAATKALCIIFRDKKCKVPMNSFYVSVIIFLVIQLHYLVNFSEIEYGQEDILQNSSYISCAMEALKALVKREKSSQTCFTSLAGSWDLLSSPENYIEGVLLLAKAIVKHHRGLDYAVFTKVIPLLHHGDDQQKLTAMAFFTALLSSESTYKVLQKHYILGLLKNWQNDSNPTYRRLSLHGIGNVAHHLQTDRSKVCCAANRLFQDLLKNLDTKDKPLMQDQVLAMIVPLLLSLQDQHPEVAKSRRDSLKECRAFLGWTTNDNLDSWNVICKHLVEDHRGTLQNFLYQAQDYSHSARPSTRIAATMFIVWHISRFHLPAPGKQSCAKVRNGPLEASLRLLSIRKRASCPCCSGTKKRTQVLPSSIQMFPLFPTILYLKRISIRIKITV
ncbi:maestro heat-like repeat-containing protein family member 6 isoform X6 [Hemicordylus capensis]|uniref:maestro heat-like repeat-containing protein family member 6 isoform X6 n=1 Tax=Hemicordylus capensis TaxID=884348 RepID=UPI0023022973|nr:maestro heat-like repeat-containing protein family member 6 isoform X6 [Hemicordylus capensis]